MQNNEITLFCPFRKETYKNGLTKEEDFLPCLKEKCALWISTPMDGHCGLKKS